MKIAFLKNGAVTNELLRLDNDWKDNSIELIWDIAEATKTFKSWIGSISTVKARKELITPSYEAHCYYAGSTIPFIRHFQNIYSTIRILMSLKGFNPQLFFLFDQTHLLLKLSWCRINNVEPIICFARENQINSISLLLFKKFKIRYFIAPSQYFFCELKKVGINTQTRIRLPRYPDLFFNGTTEDGYPHYDFNYIFVGRLIRAKGIYELLSAFSVIVKDHPEVGLYLIGDGPEKNNIIEYIKDQNLTENVVLLGQKNNIAVGAYLRKADVLVFPSYTEGFAKVWYEAMLLGCPMITTRLDSIKELLEDNKSVLFVSPKDYVELANRMRFLYENHTMRISLSREIHDVYLNKLKNSKNFLGWINQVCNEFNKEYCS